MRCCSRILLFSCGLFIYHSLAGAYQAPKTWYICVSGFDWYTLTYGFESGVLKACALFSGTKGIGDDDNIIVIAPDSAAYHYKNAVPGKLIFDHSDIDDSLDNEYDKVQITYKSHDITKEVFYGILSGNKTAVKGFAPEKVIESGPDDTIVLIFITLGHYGMMTLAPNELLYATYFIPFLEKLKEEKKFKQMLILIESMMAGSLFDGYLCKDCNIIAMTNGAKEDASVWACGFNEHVDTHTSSCYMKAVLEELETLINNGELGNSTLFDFYQNVRTRSNDLGVDTDTNLYGDLELGNRKLSEFISSKPNN